MLRALAPSKCLSVAQSCRRSAVLALYRTFADYEILQMPALSPTMTSGTIVEWKKQPGDEIGAGDTLCDVETDKATVSYDMQEDAVLAKLLAGTGQELQVGEPVAVLVDSVDSYQAFLQADKDSPIDFSAGSGAAAPSAEPPAPAPAPATEAAPPASAVAIKRTVSDKYILMPSARHLAESKGLDATGLVGSGKGGRVTKGDVLAALSSGVQLPKLSAAAGHGAAAPSSAPVAAPTASASAAAATSPPLPPAGTAGGSPASSDYTDVPNSNMRKIIARRLAESKATVPHFYASATCELDDVLQMRKKLKAKYDVSVSVNDVIIKCAAAALKDVPLVNAKWDDKAKRAVSHGDGTGVDISVAVATPTGLITPIVFNADQLGLTGISATVRDLATRAKENKLKPEEFQGGTFTISNLGMFGIGEFSAVINPPQSTILAVGGGIPELLPPKGAENGGDIVGEPRMATVMNARVSCDRRVVDEGTAALFLQTFKKYVEDPALLAI